MQNSLPTYTHYKPSGVQWLGDIPEHWEATSLGSLIQLKSDKNHPDYEVLSVYREYGVIQKDSRDDNHNATSENTSSYKAVEPGDLVVNKMKAWQGSMGISSFKGIVSPAYITCKITSMNVYSEYLHQLLRCNTYIGEYNRISYGVRVGQWDMHFEDFKHVTVLLPPKEEQTAIATFLDRKTALIDKAIGLKEKQIELLKERRQILIHQAVTQGLNPDVPMKDSGVEWIGEIPEHWEVKRLKRIIKDLESGVSVNASEAESALNEEIGVLKTSCVYNYIFEQNENKKVFESDLRRVSCPVKANTIIISRMNAPDLVGASGFVSKDYPNLFLPDRLWQTVFFEDIGINALWLSKTFVTKGFRDCITSIANGSSPSMKNISKGDFLNLTIAVPPFKEQTEIVNYIETATQKIDKAIGLKEQEIEKLKEYKASLINSVVTGKVKVTENPEE